MRPSGPLTTSGRCYLPIDPKPHRPHLRGDHSGEQPSGKGGVAYLMDRPRPRPAASLQVEFSKHVQEITEAAGRSSLGEDARRLRGDLPVGGSGLRLITARCRPQGADQRHGTAARGRPAPDREGPGNGTDRRTGQRLKADLGIVLEVKDYSEHALTEGSGASAVAYVECAGATGRPGGAWGATPPFRRLTRAVVSAANRPQRVIRPAVESDVPELVAMVRELADFENLSDQLRSPRTVSPARSSGRRHGQDWVVEVGGALVGHALWYRTFLDLPGKTGNLAGGHLHPAGAPRRATPAKS